MAIDAKKYIDTFFNITKGFVDANKENSTVKLLSNAIESMSAVLNKIDKFLQSNNINVKETYADVKDKLANYTVKGKTKISEYANEIKEKGFGQFIKDKKNAITGKLRDKFASDQETTAGPPDKNGQSFLITMMEKLTKSIDNLTSATNGKADTAEEKQEERRKGMFQRMRDSFSKQNERSDKRKKEVDDEKHRFGKDEKGKSEGKGILGSLLSAIGGLSTTILGGFKGILKAFVPGLAEMAGKGIVRTIVGLVPWMLKKIASPLTLLTKGALGTVARGALTVGGSLLGGAASAAGTAVVSAVSAVGLPVIGGVLLAGAALYGGYKLYKYLNRNSTGNGVYSDLTRLRLQLYGFSDVHREHYHKLFDLEMLMKNYHDYRNNNFILKKFDNEFKNKVMEIFEVSREEKEKYQVLNQWFMKRFLPAYKAFMEAFYSVNPKLYLDDLDKLKPEELFKLISVLRIPTGIFDIKYVPIFSNPTAVVDKQQIDDLLNSIRDSVKKLTDEGKGKSASEISQENKAKSKTDQAGKGNEDKSIKDAVKNSLPPTASKTPTSPFGPKNNTSVPNNGSEGENKPKDESIKSISDKVNTPLIKATGDLIKDNKNLEGIATKLSMSKIYNLDPNVLELFSGMAKEYFALTGKVINVNEAFRNSQDQAALYQKYGPGRAAPPGSSLHEHGLAIDINSLDADELDRLGLMRKYGFTRPIGGEKWHIEPAGVSLNPTAARDNPETRLRAVLSSPGHGGGGFGSMDGSTKYKRNIDLQRSIFDSDSGKDIDPLKDLNKKLEDSGKPSVNGNTVSKNSDTRQIPVQESVGSNEQIVKPNDTYKREMPASGEFPIFEPNSKTDYEPKPPMMPDRGLDKTPQPVETYNKNMDPGQTGSMRPEAAIQKAANMTGMNPSTMSAFAKIESSLNPNAINKVSNATGLFQITPNTWKGLLSKYGQQYNIPPNASPTDPYYNSLLGSLYAKENLQSLGNYQGSGIREDVALYLAHHFGLSGGKRIINTAAKDPNTQISSAVSTAAYRSNTQELGNKTVGQYVQYLADKMSRNGSNSQQQTVPYNGGKGLDLPIDKNTNQPNNVPVQNSYPSQPNNQYPRNNQPLYKTPDTSINPLRPSLPPPEPPPQPSKTLNFDKTETLLSGMSDTLLAIKQILMSIDGKTGTDNSSSKPNDKNNDSAVQQEAIRVDTDRTPSQTSVSMSRRPVNA